MTRSAPYTVAVVRNDWLARSTAPGVTLATDFSTDEDVLPHRFANAGSIAQFNELIKRVNRHDDNGIPCLKIDVIAPLSGGDTQGQAWRRRFTPLAEWPNDGDGFLTTPFWVQFGFKIPASRLIPFAPGKGTWKFAIVANQSVSNPMGMGGQSSNGLSHVLTNNVRMDVNWPIVYVHNDAYPNGTPLNRNLPGGISASDLDLSPGWDRGAEYTNIHERYCSYRFPALGCPQWPLDTWVWFQMRIHTRTFGGTEGNELDVWLAIDGAKQWTLLQSHRNYAVGRLSATWQNGFNAVWLTPFETNRTTAGGVDTYQLYRHLIVSTQEPALP